MEYEKLCYYKKINIIYLLLIVIAIILRLFLLFAGKFSFHLIFDFIFYGMIIAWGIIDIFSKYYKSYLILKKDQIIIRNNIFKSLHYTIKEIESINICDNKYLTIILKESKKSFYIKIAGLRDTTLDKIKKDITQLYNTNSFEKGGINNNII